MKWLRTDAVLAMQKRQIAEHGGEAGVRDLGLLESALARPQNIAAYEPDSDIARLAAAYAFGIAKHHPFIDGNKRTGLVATRTFLLLNGFELGAAPAASGRGRPRSGICTREATVAQWYKDHGRHLWLPVA